MLWEQGLLPGLLNTISSVAIATLRQLALLAVAAAVSFVSGDVSERVREAARTARTLQYQVNTEEDVLNARALTDGMNFHLLPIWDGEAIRVVPSFILWSRWSVITGRLRFDSVLDSLVDGTLDPSTLLINVTQTRRPRGVLLHEVVILAGGPPPIGGAGERY